MNSQLLNRAPLRAKRGIPQVLAWLLLSTSMLAAQDTISAGPLLLHQVRTIYVVPSSDEVLSLIRARLEKWDPVVIVSKMEEADAILKCHTGSTIVPAKVIVRLMTTEVTLVERRSQKPIWRTAKAATCESAGLADEVVEQLKKDWRKSASEY